MNPIKQIEQGTYKAVQLQNYAAINVASEDYINTSALNGFFIYIPSTTTGAIKVVTTGGQTITITDYTNGTFLRQCARFSKVVSDGTVATGLEAWW